MGESAALSQFLTGHGESKHALPSLPAICVICESLFRAIPRAYGNMGAKERLMRVFRRSCRVCWGVVWFVALSAFCPGANGQMSGYTQKGMVAERDMEQRFQGILSPEEARKQHRYLTAEPHPPGSERNNELARYIGSARRSRDLPDLYLLSPGRQQRVGSARPRAAQSRGAGCVS